MLERHGSPGSTYQSGAERLNHTSWPDQLRIPFFPVRNLAIEKNRCYNTAQQLFITPARWKGKVFMKKHWFPILVLALIAALLLPLTAFAGSDENDPDETAVSEEEQPDAQEKESILVKYVVMEGTFVGDAEEALVPFDASTNVLYSTDYSSAIYSIYSHTKEGLFYTDSEGETQISENPNSYMGSPDLSVLLFTDEDGDLAVWTKEDKSVINCDIDLSVGVLDGLFSENYKYAVLSTFDWDNNKDVLFTVNLENGESIVITDEEILYLAAVLDDGTVLFKNYDGQLIASDGSDETVLAEEVLDFCFYSAEDHSIVYNNRNLELLSLDMEASDPAVVLAENARDITPVYVSIEQYGWAGIHGLRSSRLNAPAKALYHSLILYSTDDKEIWIADISDGSTSMLLSDASRYKGDMCFTSTQTAYTLIDDQLIRLTASEDTWESESLCDAYSMEIMENGIFTAYYSNMLYVIKEGEPVLMTEEFNSSSEYTISEDMNTLVWLYDRTIWRINSPGDAAEEVTEDANYHTVGLADGKVYFINSEAVLCAASENGEIEELTENVTSFRFITR